MSSPKEKLAATLALKAKSRKVLREQANLKKWEDVHWPSNLEEHKL
jgi:hypothetical protein